jgi:hypothetical protein
MRIPTVLTALALLCATPTLMKSQSAPASTATQTAPAALPACDGVYNILRLSEITPTGSMEKFMAAVAAQQAWYASHGYPDIIFAARVLKRDPQTGAFSYSDTQMLTYHYIQVRSQAVTHDAAWDAYVKMYNDTSTIKETNMHCVPAANAPAGIK